MILPLTLPQKAIAAFLILIAVFAGGYVQGQKYGREATLKAAVTAYQTRERINHETDNLDPHALCLALGGMSDECAALLRRMDETAPN